MTDDPSCAIPAAADLSRVTLVKLALPCRDFPEAMKRSNDEASRRLGEHMLLSWYDRDRDFDSPQHVSECHEESAVPGYVDYDINHGDTLMVDIEDGRLSFSICQ